MRSENTAFLGQALENRGMAVENRRHACSPKFVPSLSVNGWCDLPTVITHDPMVGGGQGSWARNASKKAPGADAPEAFCFEACAARR